MQSTSPPDTPNPDSSTHATLSQQPADSTTAATQPTACHGRTSYVDHSQLMQKHAIFASIAQWYSANPTPIFILTDFLSVSARASDRAIFQEFVHFAKSSGWQFIHIILSCDGETNVARFESPDRTSKTTDTDTAALIQTRMEEEVGHVFPLPGLTGEYELVTTSLSAAEAAGDLAECCVQCLQQEDRWIQLRR